MPCFRPVHAWRGVENALGKAKLVFRPPNNHAVGTYCPLPCNYCIGCYLERSRQWAMRCCDEASLYKSNCFVTLSFRPEALVGRGRGLDKRDHVLFMKRLRKYFGRDCKEAEPIRFFMCGEYGTVNGRPHYHYLLFNLDFTDKVYLKTTDSGEKIYRSADLEKIWPHGFSSVGDLTFGSAAYVARYHLKKQDGVAAKNHYLDKRTGEMLPPEFTLMSRGSKVRLTGGIGRAWFEKYQSDVFPADRRVIKGVDTKPARFYDSLYEKADPVGFGRVKCERVASASANLEDNTPARLAMKEKVKLAQIQVLKNSKEI